MSVTVQQSVVLFTDTKISDCRAVTLLLFSVTWWMNNIKCQEYGNCLMILPVLHCPYDIGGKKISVPFSLKNIRIKEEVSMFFLKEKEVNTGRQRELDLVKGFLLIMIVFIHSFQTIGGVAAAESMYIRFCLRSSCAS